MEGGKEGGRGRGWLAKFCLGRCASGVPRFCFGVAAVAVQRLRKSRMCRLALSLGARLWLAGGRVVSRTPCRGTFMLFFEGVPLHCAYALRFVWMFCLGVPYSSVVAATESVMPHSFQSVYLRLLRCALAPAGKRYARPGIVGLFFVR